LAKTLGISNSYLNLIENNKRPLSAPLLIKAAQIFQVDLQSFAAESEGSLLADIMEVFGDPVFDAYELAGAEVRELVNTNSNLARAVMGLYRAYRETVESAESLVSQLTHSSPGVPAIQTSRLPTEEVSDLIQRNQNFFPDLEASAEDLRKRARLEDEDLFRGLVSYLHDDHGIEVRIEKVSFMQEAVRRFEPKKRVLYLSEVLRRGSRNFQLAHQIGLLTQNEIYNKICKDESLTTDDSRALARVALANYTAGAILMPYQPFIEAARVERYDLELLGHRFRTSFEQVCHRLTSLRKKGNEGIPFHLVRIDIAGNISKQFSASGLRFSRFNATCPRWNVHKAFMTPGLIRVQISEMPNSQKFFCVARSLSKGGGGYKSQHHVQAIGLGCEIRFAQEIVYSDGVAIQSEDAQVPVGVTCRLCERTDCGQRAFPALLHPLIINEDIRGESFFTPVHC